MKSYENGPTQELPQPFLDDSITNNWCYQLCIYATKTTPFYKGKLKNLLQVLKLENAPVGKCSTRMHGSKKVNVLYKISQQWHVTSVKLMIISTVIIEVNKTK